MQGGVPHCLTLCLLPEKEQQKQRQKEGQFGLSQHGSCVHAHNLENITLYIHIYSASCNMYYLNHGYVAYFTYISIYTTQELRSEEFAVIMICTVKGE